MTTRAIHAQLPPTVLGRCCHGDSDWALLSISNGNETPQLGSRSADGVVSVGH